jgi:tRNA threonylcarbamoyladenosine biosynthesis protein TsaB
MLIITIKTDNPEAEIGLYDDSKQLINEKWTAHRKLAETIHHKIAEVLDSQGKRLDDIGGVVVYEGPGSFTGLRIGLSVANALSYGLDVSIIGANGEWWQSEGVELLLKGENKKSIVPNYGAEVHITSPKK